MSDVLLGVTTKREVYFESLGAPITGATLMYTLTSPTNTSLVAAQAATEEGLGWYSYTIDGSTLLTSPGIYRELWAGSHGSTDLRRDSLFVCLAPQEPLVNRLELRHHVAQLLDDLVTGTSTGSNTSTTIKDTNLAGFGDDHWNGGNVYIYGGLGRAQSRLISDFTSSGGVVTVATWATTPDTTSKYELHLGWTVEEYNRAINLAILGVAKRSLITIVDQSLAHVADQVEYTIPTGFKYLAEVWSGNSTDGFVKLSTFPDSLGTRLTRPDYNEDRSRAANSTAREWMVIPGARKLRYFRAVADDYFRLVGQMVPDQLWHDQAFCDVYPEYVTYKAAALLLTQKAGSPATDRNANAQRAAFFHQMAETMKPDIRPLAGSVMV